MPNSCRARFKASFQQSSAASFGHVYLRQINYSLWSERVAHLDSSFALPLSLSLSPTVRPHLCGYINCLYRRCSRWSPALERGVAAPLGPYKLLVKLNLYGSAGIFWQIVYKLWPQRAYTQKLFIFSPLCCAHSLSLSVSCCLFRMLFPSCCPLFCHCSK